MMEKFFAKLTTMLPAFVAQFVTLARHSRIGHWYHTNRIYKFPIGSVIALVNIGSYGFGVRPVGVIKGYTDRGKYIVEMECDVNGDFFEWGNGRYVPDGQRSSQHEDHHKVNIESNFREVPQTDADLAYA